MTKLGTDTFNRNIGIIAGVSISLALLFSMALVLYGCGTTTRSINPPHPEIVTSEEAIGGPLALGTVSWSDAECKSLHNKTIAYTVVTSVGAVLAGGGTLATALLDDDKTARWVTGGLTIGSALVSAIFGTLLKFADDDFATGCRVATEPTQ